MAGHSKWSNIKHRKGRQDARRAKAFTRATKEIIISAKSGGDPESNPRLRSAIAAARSINLPNDRINSAIRRGTGEEAGGEITEITYEGYGPGGIAVLVEAATDNRNRTVAEIRHIFSKYGGNLGESGCVGWMFDSKGMFTFNKGDFSEEDIMMAGLEHGLEDIVDEEEFFEAHCQPTDFDKLRQGFEAAGLEPEKAELSRIPQNTIEISDKDDGRKLLTLMELIEENDDVQNVYANFDMPDELMAELAEE